MSLDVFAELNGLNQVLDFHLQRHGVLAANVANADTPGYRAKDISFADTLANAPMATTDKGHLSRGHGEDGQVIETVSPATRADGGGVEIEQAMAQVTANRLRYDTGIELTRRRIALLRYAAGDGSNT